MRGFHVQMHSNVKKRDLGGWRSGNRGANRVSGFFPYKTRVLGVKKGGIWGSPGGSRGAQMGGFGGSPGGVPGGPKWGFWGPPGGGPGGSQTFAGYFVHYGVKKWSIGAPRGPQGV